MSLSAPSLPSCVSTAATPTREWAQSVLLHYKSLSNATFADLAAHLHLSEVWTTSAVYQQQQMTRDEAQSLVAFLRVPDALAAAVVHVLVQPVVKVSCGLQALWYTAPAAPAHCSSWPLCVLQGHLPSAAIPTDPCECAVHQHDWRHRCLSRRTRVRTDPSVCRRSRRYRLYEIVQVYGSSFHALMLELRTRARSMDEASRGPC